MNISYQNHTSCKVWDGSSIPLPSVPKLLQILGSDSYLTMILHSWSCAKGLKMNMNVPAM